MTSSVETCSVCGQLRRVYARIDGKGVCTACHRASLRCSRCDRLGVGVRGLCWACLLAEPVDELRARAGPQRAPRLAGYLDALAASPNPQSTLRWIQTSSFALLEDVVDGRLELAHQAFDQRQGDAGEGSAIAYLRAAMVAHGALPERDETQAVFGRWLTRALRRLPDGPDRGRVEAFATWQVARELAARTARYRGAPPPSAVKHARAQVNRAIELTAWLHGQDLTLADLRQDLLDEWLAAGSTSRRAVAGFIDWECRAEHAPRLQIAWPPAAHNPPITTDHERLRALTALLENRSLTAGTRFTAAAALLFGQPLTRIAALQRSDLTRTPTGWQIRFGRRPVQSPRMLDDLLLELLARPNRSRAAPAACDWLLPGRKQRRAHHL